LHSENIAKSGKIKKVEKLFQASDPVHDVEHQNDIIPPIDRYSTRLAAGGKNSFPIII